MTNKKLIDVVQKFQMGLISRNFMAQVLLSERKAGNDPYPIYHLLMTDDSPPSVSGSFDFKQRHGKKEKKRVLVDLNYEESEVEPRNDFET